MAEKIRILNEKCIKGMILWFGKFPTGRKEFVVPQVVYFSIRKSHIVFLKMNFPLRFSSHLTLGIVRLTL